MRKPADEPAKVLLRLPPDLLATIDKRVGRNDLSRNETIVRMLRWATSQPEKR